MMIRLPQPIAFEWDEGNIDKNWVKHGVSNSEIEETFLDPHKKLGHDIHHSTEDEIRFILLGKTNLQRLLFVVFTIRLEKIRVISARNLNKKERPLYEKRT